MVLVRVDGHAAWVNAAALAAAGIGPGTPDPPGGKIRRDAAGRPDGILVDAAMDLVLARLPRPGPAELEEGIVAGLRELAALGLTGVHDAGVEPDALDAYRRLAETGRLPLRVYAMIDGQKPLPALRAELARWRPTPEIGLLGVRAVKIYADGALGSRGAALLDDYADDAGNRGLLLTAPEALRAKVAAVAHAGFQPAVHAIGDRACREVLDAFAAVPGIRALRPRVEHLQVLQPADLPRLVEVGAIASMQPVHATSDGPWVPARLGEGTARFRGAYAWRSVARGGRDARVRLGLSGRGAGPARRPPRRRDAAHRGWGAVPARAGDHAGGRAAGVHGGCGPGRLRGGPARDDPRRVRGRPDRLR